MEQTNKLTVADWRDLYEGMTQEDDGFRVEMAERIPEMGPDNLLTELELAQNRLTYAMMGIHPIYRREIELSGMVDYPNRTLALYMDNGERVLPFNDIDHSYIEFLENQKRTHKVKDIQPLSSVHLKVTEELFPDMRVVLEPVDMNTDGAEPSCGVKMLKRAWERSTIMMNHLHEELQKCGADKAFRISRDDLRAYCTSNIGSAQFDRSLAELGALANEANGMDAISTPLIKRNTPY